MLFIPAAISSKLCSFAWCPRWSLYSCCIGNICSLLPPRPQWLPHEEPLSWRRLARDQFSRGRVVQRQCANSFIIACWLAVDALSSFSFLTSWKVFSGMTASGSGLATTCIIISVLLKNESTPSSRDGVPSLHFTSPSHFSNPWCIFPLSIRDSSCNVTNSNLRIDFWISTVVTSILQIE